MEIDQNHLKSYDVSLLKTKCPAFKNGCPFVGIKDNDKILEAIKKCPEFSNGCPFKEVQNLTEVYQKLSEIPNPQSPAKHLAELFKAMHDVSEPLEQDLGDCPVFHTSAGCPFKTVRSPEDSTLVDPVESVAHDERILNTLLQYNVSNVKNCPAFATGCPYAKLDNKEFQLEIQKCPEFKNGCPFKDLSNLADVYKLLGTIPNSRHTEILEKAFRNIHTISKENESYGKCPVFHNEDDKMSCPFKNIRSEGKHLVEPVSYVLDKKV